jgi:hypothetical protein
MPLESVVTLTIFDGNPPAISILLLALLSLLKSKIIG